MIPKKTLSLTTVSSYSPSMSMKLLTQLYYVRMVYGVFRECGNKRMHLGADHPDAGEAVPVLVQEHPATVISPRKRALVLGAGDLKNGADRLPSTVHHNPVANLSLTLTT